LGSGRYTAGGDDLFAEWEWTVPTLPEGRFVNGEYFINSHENDRASAGSSGICTSKDSILSGTAGVKYHAQP